MFMSDHIDGATSLGGRSSTEFCLVERGQSVVHQRLVHNTHNSNSSNTGFGVLLPDTDVITTTGTTTARIAGAVEPMAVGPPSMLRFPLDDFPPSARDSPQVLTKIAEDESPWSPLRFLCPAADANMNYNKNAGGEDSCKDNADRIRWLEDILEGAIGLASGETDATSGRGLEVPTSLSAYVDGVIGKTMDGRTHISNAASTSRGSCSGLTTAAAYHRPPHGSMATGANENIPDPSESVLLSLESAPTTNMNGCTSMMMGSALSVVEDRHHLQQRLTASLLHSRRTVNDSSSLWQGAHPSLLAAHHTCESAVALFPPLCSTPLVADTDNGLCRLSSGGERRVSAIFGHQEVIGGKQAGSAAALLPSHPAVKFRAKRPFVARELFLGALPAATSRLISSGCVDVVLVHSPAAHPEDGQELLRIPPFHTPGGAGVLMLVCRFCGIGLPNPAEQLAHMLSHHDASLGVRNGGGGGSLAADELRQLEKRVVLSGLAKKCSGCGSLIAKRTRDHHCLRRGPSP